jgi:branched-subunit amino acid transport protein
MNEVLIILGMMVVTFGVRYPVLAIVGRVDLPEPVLRALKYVPVAVLTAIIAPAVLIQEDKIDLMPDNAYLIGAIVAIIVSWRTKNLLATIVIGMAVFLIWRGLFV